MRLFDRRGRRERILYLVVILVGLIATYAATSARDQAVQSKHLAKQVQAEQKSLANAQIGLASAQMQLAEQTRSLCVKIKRGRAVIKKIVDQNGLFVASQIALVRCPPQVTPPKLPAHP